VFEQAPIPSAPKAQKAEKAVKPVREKRAGTKQEKALAVYKRMQGAKFSEIIQAIETEVGMSKTGATTYAYNCKRIVSKGG
jgi:hypothetical protein